LLQSTQEGNWFSSCSHNLGLSPFDAVLYSAKVSGNKFGFDPVTLNPTAECNSVTGTAIGIILWSTGTNNGLQVTIGGNSLVEANFFADVSYQSLQLDGNSPLPFPTATGFVNVIGNYFGKQPKFVSIGS